MTKRASKLWACGALLFLAAAHPMSISRLRIQINDSAVSWQWRMQIQTLQEVPQLNLHDSHQVSNELIRSKWQDIEDYLESHLNMQFDGEDAQIEINNWQRLNEDIDWLSVSGELSKPIHPSAIRIDTSAFFDDGNPDHRMDIEVRGLSTKPMSVLLDKDRTGWDFSTPSAFGDYLKFGFTHVLEGYDHLAFLIALLFGIATGGMLLWAVSAFTIAHTITLACSALGIFSLSPQIVEPGIALSIVLTLWWHRRQQHQAAWQPAMLFGFLHGFGFAGVLGEIGLPTAAKTTSLFSFNLGVELGQLCFILPVAAIAYWCRKKLLPKTSKDLNSMLAIALGSFGLFIFSGHFFSWHESPLMAISIAIVPCLLCIALVRERTRDIANSFLLLLLYVAGQQLGSL